MNYENMGLVDITLNVYFLTLLTIYLRTIS